MSQASVQFTTPQQARINPFAKFVTAGRSVSSMPSPIDMLTTPPPRAPEVSGVASNHTGTKLLDASNQTGTKLLDANRLNELMRMKLPIGPLPLEYKQMNAALKRRRIKGKTASVEASVPVEAVVPVAAVEQVKAVAAVVA